VDESRAQAPFADDSSLSKWPAAFLTKSVAIAILILLFGRSMMRPFDMDEHQFVAPSIFLNNQCVYPYSDYPYFHMPNLVYVYAGVLPWFSHKLLAARTISVLFGWGTVLLLWRAGWTALAAHPVHIRWLLGGGFLAAYLCSQLFAYTNGWNHDSAVFFAIAAFMLQCRGMRIGNVRMIALAGAMAGMSLGIRLSFALIVVPMGISLLVGASAWTRRGRVVALGAAVGGALVMLIPAFIPWMQDPDTFFFGNLGYAELSRRFYAGHGEGYATLPAKVWYLFRKFFSDPGNAFLLLAGSYSLGFAYWRLRAWRSRFANELGLLMGLMPALLIGAWGPTPAQQQYFFMLLPFLTLAGIYAMALDCESTIGLQRWRHIVLWAALLPALIGFPRWYWQAAYLPDVDAWTPMRVHQVGEWMKYHCPPGARVMTAEPLFPLEAGMEAYPEYAVGRFVFHVGELMQPEERAHYQMAWGEQLDRVLTDRPPDAIFRHTKSPTEPLAAYARQHGFRKLEYPFVYRDLNPQRSIEIFELWIRVPSSTRLQEE